MRTEDAQTSNKLISRALPDEALWLIEETRLRRRNRMQSASQPSLLKRGLAGLVRRLKSTVLAIRAAPRMTLERMRSMFERSGTESEEALDRSPAGVLIHIALLPVRLAVRTVRMFAGMLLRLYRRALRSVLRFRRKSVEGTRRIVRSWRIAREEVRLLRDGASALLGPPVNRVQRQQGAVAYLVYNALPYHSAGYATRSQGLVSGLRSRGIDCRIVTRLGYPQVFAKYRDEPYVATAEIDNVPYHRVQADIDALMFRSSSSYLGMNIKATADCVRPLNPAVVHGASNFVTGLTAVAVARQLGVPSIYEVRGLWEVTQSSRDSSYVETLHFRHSLKLETQACLEADRVIAITQALRDELVQRGIPAEKISVVPNGVDTARFHPAVRDDALAARLGIPNDAVVIGYVGSILDYEGIDDLLHATRIMIDRGLNVVVLIVGDGAAYKQCRDLSSALGLDPHVIFTGRVPHAEVESYYSLIDIAPFPRKPLPVCEMVSPLKPFEAMAMAKCVVVSSVAALAEIVGDRPIGLVHEKGNIKSLAEVLERACLDKELREALGRESRRFVVEERDWSILAGRVLDIYREFGLIPASEPAVATPAVPAQD